MSAAGTFCSGSGLLPPLSSIRVSISRVHLASRVSGPVRIELGSWHRFTPLVAGACMLALYLLIV